MAKHEEKEGKKRSGCRKVLLVLLILVLVAAAAAFIWYKVHEDRIKELLNSPMTMVTVGEEAPEFEVTTTDGQTVSMSGLLEGKDALVVVLFATWCGPCEEEFPEMDKVYQKYQDRLGMIALDIDRLDSVDDAKEYAESHGLSFPIAYISTEDLPEMYDSGAYPTTLLIDRNGKIAFCRVGSIPEAENFEKVVTTFLGDDYQERQLGYYTIYAYDGEYIPGVEFTVTSESGTETYVTGEDGTVDIFTEKPQELKINVTNVPDGYQIDDNGEATTYLISGSTKLPVSKEE